MIRYRGNVKLRPKCVSIVCLERLPTAILFLLVSPVYFQKCIYSPQFSCTVSLN